MNERRTEPYTIDNPQVSAGGPAFGAAAYRVLVALASLRLTVVLFSLAIALVFFGTLAQMYEDVWPVVDGYFRSFYVMVPLKLFSKFGVIFFGLPSETEWKGSFPFPGGWLIGFAMLTNLLAAHAIRFHMTWRRSGIFLIHAGVILLMLGELITGLFAVESRMSIMNGETTEYIDITRKHELAFFETLDEKTNRVVAVPHELLGKGETVKHDSLPVDIEVLETWKNTKIEFNFAPGDKRKIKTFWSPEDGVVSMDGTYGKIFPADEEVGVDGKAENMPALRLRFKRKGADEVVAEHFVSLNQYRNAANRYFISPTRTITVDGKTYRIELRNVREQKPYSLRLLKLEHDVHPGTDKAKNYASTVELYDTRTGERREVRLWMNNPLRHDGVTMYQSGIMPHDSGTILQVVRNPGWLLPYLSCIVVAIGMLVHFGITLNRFLKRRAAK
jgi:ResB-like family